MKKQAGINGFQTQLCDGTPKAAKLPQMLANFARAFNDSLNQSAALRWFQSRGAGASPSKAWEAMRAFTQYRDEKPCQDTAFSIRESLESQLRDGFFGDCGAYAVAISAILKASGHCPGYWLLVGDKDDNAKHILNWFPMRSAARGARFGANPDTDAILIDATVAYGDGLILPSEVTHATLIEPATGRIVHTWSR